MKTNAPKPTPRAWLLLLAVMLLPGCVATRQPDRVQAHWHIGETVELPMVSVDGLVLVQADVEGAGMSWFALDTGAEFDIIHSRLADRLGLKRHGGARINANLPADWVEGVALRLGSAAYRTDRMFATAALDKAGQVLGTPVDGLLGQLFFRSFVVELDYANQIVRLHPARGFRREGDAIPMKPAGWKIAVPATVQFAAAPPLEGLFFLDTGSQARIALHETFVAAHELDGFAASFAPTETMMLDGPIQRRTGRAARFQVGPVLIEEPLIAIGPPSADDRLDGMIGAEFLKQFRVTLDYSRSQLWLDEF